MRVTVRGGRVPIFSIALPNDLYASPYVSPPFINSARPWSRSFCASSKARAEPASKTCRKHPRFEYDYTRHETDTGNCNQRSGGLPDAQSTQSLVPFPSPRAPNQPRLRPLPGEHTATSDSCAPSCAETGRLVLSQMSPQELQERNPDAWSSHRARTRVGWQAGGDSRNAKTYRNERQMLCRSARQWCPVGLSSPSAWGDLPQPPVWSVLCRGYLK